MVGGLSPNSRCLSTGFTGSPGISQKGQGRVVACWPTP
jgi:hypothetical protein